MNHQKHRINSEDTIKRKPGNRPMLDQRPSDKVAANNEEEVNRDRPRVIDHVAPMTLRVVYQVSLKNRRAINMKNNYGDRKQSP
ncbi:hypothetical protein D3C77_392410 [compost metagenome]